MNLTELKVKHSDTIRRLQTLGAVLEETRQEAAELTERIAIEESKPEPGKPKPREQEAAQAAAEEPEKPGEDDEALVYQAKK